MTGGYKFPGKQLLRESLTHTLVLTSQKEPRGVVTISRTCLKMVKMDKFTLGFPVTFIFRLAFIKTFTAEIFSETEPLLR